jgi:serine/threonine-protein kinase HipA
MKINEINVCPGTLAEGFGTYSPRCLRKLFNGRKVSHLLQYETPPHEDEVSKVIPNNRKRVSISGAQEKLSLLLEKNKLRLSREGEQETHFLKFITRDVRHPNQVPANEHLTMQIARQVFGIQTAENAMIFFQDGTPAFITKRFELKEDGIKWKMEDFASLTGKSIDISEASFNYEHSYEELGALIRRFVPAWKIEIEKFFSLVLFNYLISNGEVHLKNVTLLESRSGDYLMSPAYNLINTRIHVDDADFALNKGLFDDDFRSKAYQQNGYPSFADFFEFGRRIGINESRITQLMKTFVGRQIQVETLTRNSFLNEKLKWTYLLHYNTRLNMLNCK